MVTNDHGHMLRRQRFTHHRWGDRSERYEEKRWVERLIDEWRAEEIAELEEMMALTDAEWNEWGDVMPPILDWLRIELMARAGER